jgi:glycosyltransferase involved in cell wall biosynthesis
MMKVLLVSNMYAYPGNWDKLDELGRHVQLEVVTPARWSTPEELHPVDSAPRYNGDRWVHHPLPTITQGNPFRYIYRPIPLLRVLRSFRPDVVHVEQEPESLSLLELSLFKRLISYRLVFVAWENMHPLRRGALFRWVNFRVADGGIFGLTAARNRARQLGYRGPAAVIPQYSFENNLEAYRTTDPVGPMVVGFAGRLVVTKGLRVLLEAIREIPDAKLLVAGDGPMRAELSQMGSVELLGTLDRRAMGDFWARIDVLVLPALTTKNAAEQFGRVLVEAMANGVPVIGSTAGGIPETIGDAGIVTPEGDSHALAAALRSIHTQPDLRSRLIARGRGRVDRVFHHDVITARTIAFYERVLTGNPSQASNEE